VYLLPLHFFSQDKHKETGVSEASSVLLLENFRECSVVVTVIVDNSSLENNKTCSSSLQMSVSTRYAAAITGHK
jgi:hypothetical protein